MDPIIQVPLADAAAKLSVLFQKAQKESDPAMYIYKEGARKTLFEIESLLRLAYGTTFSKKICQQLKLIKKLEDRLGKVDEYDNFQKEFTAKKLQAPLPAFFLKKMEKEIKKLNTKLKKHDFFNRDLRSLSKIKNKDKGGSTAIKSILEKELEAAKAIFVKYRSGFTDMEEQVHELRRRLRWISIYAQSLDGAVKLKKDAGRYEWEKRYHQKNWVNSAYNKLPQKQGLKQYIFFNKKAFMALNAVIQSLGEIKDKGFYNHAIEKALKKTGTPAPGGLVTNKEKTLLRTAHALLNDFFIKDRIPELLIL